MHAYNFVTAAGVEADEVKFLILLDTGSSVTIIMNAEIVFNIRTVKERVKLITNGGVVYVNQKATLKGYPKDVWFCPHAKVNCISFSEANDLGFIMSYDHSFQKFRMCEQTAGVSTEFDRMGRIYALDTRRKSIGHIRISSELHLPTISEEKNKRKTKVRFNLPTVNDTVPTVERNAKLFSRKENERAEVCKMLHACIGYPTVQGFKHIIRTNQIRGCPVTTQDVDLMLKIYGPSVFAMKGTTTKMKPHRNYFDDIKIPEAIKEAHKGIKLTVDVMYVCKRKFLVAKSRDVEYIQIVPIKNSSAEQLRAGMDAILHEYNSNDFMVTHVDADLEFESIRKQLEHPECGSIKVSICNKKEHVAEVERTIRTIKERFRSIWHSLPFKRIPKVMLDAMLDHVKTWLNSFPRRNGISDTYSPRTIITGKTIDYTRQCRIPFGSYVQAYQDNDVKTNTERERTFDSILLESKPQGGYTVLNLRSGEPNQVSHVKTATAPSAVLDRVDKLAGKDGMEIRDEPILGMYVRSTGVWERERYTSIFDTPEPSAKKKRNEKRKGQPAKRRLVEIPDAEMDPNKLPSDDTMNGGEMSGNDADQSGSGNLKGSGDAKDDNIDNLTGFDDTSAGDSNLKGSDSDGGNLSGSKITASGDGNLTGSGSGNLNGSASTSNSSTDQSRSTIRRQSTMPGRSVSTKSDKPRRSPRLSERDKHVDYSATHIQAWEEIQEDEEMCHFHTQSCVNAMEYDENEAELIACIMHKLLMDEYDEEEWNYVQQYSLKKGIEKYGKRGEQSAIDEMTQLHDRGSFRPLDVKKLSPLERKKAMEALIFMIEKRDGKVKSRTCANGKKQRGWIEKESASSPTARCESIMLTAVMEAREHRIVRTTDIPNAFIQTDNEQLSEDHGMDILKIRGMLVEYLVKIAPNTYAPYVTYERGTPVLYLELLKAVYGMLKSALLFYRKLRKDLEGQGFERNPYDICVFNKMINGHQLTVTSHVDDLKYSCCDQKAIDDFEKWLEKTYGEGGTKPMEFNHGPVFDYLGITLDYSVPGKVKMHMKDYVQKIIDEFEFKDEITSLKSAKTPAAEHLFSVSSHATKLSKEKAEVFHGTVAKGLFLCKRTRPDLNPTIPFLCTRVKEPDEDDWKKLIRMLKYLEQTKDLVLTLEADCDEGVLMPKWYPDAAFAVHADFKSHTGGVMTLGKGSVTTISQKQKLVTKSSTEAELVGVDDCMPQLMWTKYFLEKQGYTCETKMYQDNTSAIQLEKNGMESSSKRT